MSSNSAATNQKDVLVIGAGPGNLALAQILRKHDIPFQIFERDDKIDPRRQGWSFALIEALHELPPLISDDLGDIHTTSVNHNIGVNKDTMTIVQAASGQIMAVLGNRLPDEPGHLIRGDRQRLREYFSQHLDLQVGKIFSHYEEDAEGVTAFFTDGTSARGCMLVGGDGLRSKVREQLLAGYTEPDAAKLEPSQWIPIFGQCELSREQFEPIHDFSSAGILAAGPTIRYMIGPREIQADRSSASYYWAGAYASQGETQSEWAAEAEWVQNATRQELFDRSKKLTENFAPFLTKIIDYTGVEGMLTRPPRFIEYVSPRQLPRGRVTLLGDAVHTMVPFRGQGANTAIRDACDLGRLLIKAGGVPQAPEDLLQEYASNILPRGREMVLSSRASGQQLQGVLAATKGRVDTFVGAGSPPSGVIPLAGAHA
ncbi:uncharacterized protein PV06_01388 [Exophiala oligosperma]|uniref:FAD-binding domain-containing protein n=1 Tax=Exophiala oligosperma TaxID=215243 RepID=A0A0D2B9C9_9EURO|nr:uncharacterized protein PV06_01388 [Exophiala oligosperma]KIW48826.1 hypothetical protein PV06_01388 [Exophiala oligosperma]